MVRKNKASWWVDFQVRHKRYRRRCPENTREGALAYESLLRQRLAKGEDIATGVTKDDKVLTFKDFSAEWFDTVVKIDNKPSEIRTKESILRNHLIPFFGGLLLKDIGSHQIERFKMLKIRENLSPKSVNNQLIILLRCLHVAVEWGRIEKAPKVARLKTISQRLDFLSPIESRGLVQSCDEPMWRDMLLMGLRTGMRLGELCGLEWRDIDFQRKVVTVQRSLVRGIIGTPKNHKIRHIPMTEDLCRTLYERRNKSSFVFHQTNSQPFTDWMAETGIRRACKKAGIRSIGWHTLRHTFASHLVSEGVPLNVVQELLGHSSIIMTMKYAHLAPSATRYAVDVLEKAEDREMSVIGMKCQPGVNLEKILEQVSY